MAVGATREPGYRVYGAYALEWCQRYTPALCLHDMARAFFVSWGKKGRLVSFGWLLALLVLLATFVLWLTDKMDPVQAGMFAALALAIMLSVFPVKWNWSPAS